MFSRGVISMRSVILQGPWGLNQYTVLIYEVYSPFCGKHYANTCCFNYFQHDLLNTGVRGSIFCNPSQLWNRLSVFWGMSQMADNRSCNWFKFEGNIFSRTIYHNLHWFFREDIDPWYGVYILQDGGGKFLYFLGFYHWIVSFCGISGG